MALFAVLMVKNTNCGSGGLEDEQDVQFALFENHQVPVAYTKLATLPRGDHSLTLRIGLKNKRIEDSLDGLLEQMSNPQSSKFRSHLDEDELAQLSTPPEETIEIVRDWLSGHGFGTSQIQFSKHKDWIKLEGVSLKKAEAMLDTTYYIYRHDDGEHIIRTERYSLPKHLHEHIDLIQPTTMFGRLHKQRSMISGIAESPASSLKSLLDPSVPNTCSDPAYVTNDCLREFYKTEGYKVTSSSNMIGITGFIGESANFADAQTFLKAQRPAYVGMNFTVVSVKGGVNPQQLDDNQIATQLGVEGNMDSQVALGFTLPTKNIFYTTPGSPPFNPDTATPQNTNEPFLDWLEYILSRPAAQIPKVISTSYGDNEQTVPLSYARRVCSSFGQLSALGVSVIFSSGDNGVGQTGFCYKHDGSMAFLPTFPASCPYVTSVGATQNFSPEVAVSEDGPGGYASGGGFSNYFTTPSWQKDAVRRYLQQLGPRAYRGMYNQNGRGYPDVSAQGAKYVIAYQGNFITVGGTSASAPTFASIIALLNDYSLSLGGSPLGYLNPWLYQVGLNGLKDITHGSSSGCNTTGFFATNGWDPVTGLGTPDFKKLQKVVEPWSRATAAHSKQKAPKRHGNRQIKLHYLH
ncbi:hypothetical protein O181_049058 [Austropuccinia psidii MF-1]|uniref:tripeptidyl-peptidase II n=1 Tax=Austropuccinia psidii MF-1 TaxID=1389203 RepID=A0A9Q3DWS4_9BASI|nr:hypothetical protein [Austropuccinia psidii MF-1]